ncbi:hypothetical protein [Brevibacterium sp. FAM 24630]|uniref:hypothetical protein n=1 Tax=Brevibacterium sp. FAM 24630 TaxID=3415680 RepID=UPI003C79FB40
MQLTDGQPWSTAVGTFVAGLSVSWTCDGLFGDGLRVDVLVIELVLMLLMLHLDIVLGYRV